MPDRAIKYLPETVKSAVSSCGFKNEIREIRLRSGLPLSFTSGSMLYDDLVWVIRGKR